MLGSHDLVVQAVANAYLQIIADASRIEAVKAQVDTDQAVYKRTHLMKRSSGTAAGIDVLRSEVQLKTEQQVLVAARNQFQKDKLALGRIIGLPPAQVFELADSAPFSQITGISQEEAIRLALAQRPDYQSSRKLVEAAQHTLAAARAEWYPTVDLNGFFGMPVQLSTTRMASLLTTGALNFNIFNGGRIRSDIEKAKAALKQRSDELADQGAQIEVEVRMCSSTFNQHLIRSPSLGTIWV